MKSSFIKKNSKGFTLVELLIVVAIVGLLSSIVLVSTKESRTKAKIAKKVQTAASFHHKLGSELVGEWLLNENTGSGIMDSSGNGNFCSVMAGSWVSSAEPNMKSAYQFNGDALGCMGFPNNDALSLGGGDITVSGWVKINTASASGRIFGFQTVPGSYSFYISSTNRIYVSLGLGTGTSGNKILNLGEWYFVAFSYQKSTQTLNYYVDGELDTSQIFNPAQWDMCLGGAGTCGPLFWIGRSARVDIDEVRVYKTSLLSSDIKNIYALEANKYEK